MATTEQVTTAEQLLNSPDLGPCELVWGELVMVPPGGGEHSEIGIMGIALALGSFVKQRRLGVVYGPDAGFQIGHNPDTVRVPDVAFVRAERIPPDRSKGFIQGAPDLAVEILSPTDRASEVNAKVEEWLEAGCRIVWVVDPNSRTVYVHGSRTEIDVLRTSDTLLVLFRGSCRRPRCELEGGGNDLIRSCSLAFHVWSARIH